MDRIQRSDASSNLMPVLPSPELPIDPLGSGVEGHNQVDTLVKVPDNVPPQIIAVFCPPQNPPVATPTPNRHIRERGIGVDSSISSGGVDPTTVDTTKATPSKPPSASDINFAENPNNNNPTPIKSIGVPAHPAR